jgi:transcriptional regulator with XRE-family HTH domain
MEPVACARSALGTLCPPLDPLYPSLGKAIRFLRKSAGLTQEELADRSGIHTTEISRLERGWRNPSYETLKRLAEGLDHPCSRIFALEEIFEQEEDKAT